MLQEPSRKVKTRMISCFKGKFKVTSPRGYRTLNGKREYHGGVDVVSLGDKTVYAVADGVVDATPYEQNGFGYYVRQLLPDGRRIYYAHLAKGSVCVKTGQKIKKGDKLGTMGATGRVTGAHTHLELRVKGTTKDSLDISEFTKIPNKVGTYDPEKDSLNELAKKLQKKCGFEDQTIDYLMGYKYSKDLFEKLLEAMRE